MKTSRRDIIKAGVLGAAAASASFPLIAAERETSPGRPLDILILGGTGFIGPHMVREALRRGHSVTLFNRGRTNIALFPDLETIKGDRNNGLDGLRGRRWDAVIDNSGYVPRHVRDSAGLLAPSVSHYLFVSTVSVYASFKQDLDENSALATIADESIEQVTGETYGALKALCETAVRQVVGEERSTILRPTYICGPGDHTDRFTWWPVRTSSGGEMLWPGRPGDAIQIIDVRDFANFTVDCIQKKIAGTYVTATPENGYTMGDLLRDCQAVTATKVDDTWVDEAFALSASKDSPVKNHGAFPVWHPQRGPDAVTAQIISKAARGAGMHNRPVRETIRDLMRWWRTLPDDRTSTMQAGMPAEYEAELIARWKKNHA
ncbi:MAG: NAD-dependent epimerase/dehydratase family protein [Woeseiaceae bacterium]|nr:NAD-dependent epimerase/dehydratase family protein [Woeseiaceae bacterium]NIP21483.1 NAD-dependent epimerase/dehydratase family protein [Woeseiaceae bacterium]NIS90471.1 NAD-dependent epimerase/dehydratase family protein [Woeseiaceae bacterium]